MAETDHVNPRPENGIYEYVRRVPKAVAHLDDRAKVRQSLGTRDYAVAKSKARTIDAALDELWSALLQGETATDAWERYRSAVKLATALGFTYRPMAEILAQRNPREIVDRITAAAEHASMPGAVEAITGTAPEPSPRLSDLWTLYETNNRAWLGGFSPNQLRKHTVPRERAIAYAIAHLGNKELGAITRDDVLSFRDWWVEKMEAEDLRADTVNRCFSDIKGMLTVVDNALRTNYGVAWERIRIRSTNKTKSGKRATYSVEFIQQRLLALGALDGMNLEARVVVYLILETGARPSELCNLRTQDIFLDAAIPYISVTERDDRRSKTEYSIRTIPLVGCALWAMKQLPGGFVQYADKEDTLSTTINKFLKENGLRPSPAHVLYSFRHTFQDRILAAGAPDRLQADLMGHEFDRPAYGEGASMQQKLELLDRIKFEWPEAGRA